VPWDYRTTSGGTLWDALCRKYDDGVRDAVDMQATWRSLAGAIDPQRHGEVAERLAIQVADAAKWRDRILEYFQRYSGRPIPKPSR
jgi:alpha-glucuronidase